MLVKGGPGHQLTCVLHKIKILEIPLVFNAVNLTPFRNMTHEKWRKISRYFANQLVYFSQLHICVQITMAVKVYLNGFIPYKYSCIRKKSIITLCKKNTRKRFTYDDNVGSVWPKYIRAVKPAEERNDGVTWHHNVGVVRLLILSEQADDTFYKCNAQHHSRLVE